MFEVHPLELTLEKPLGKSDVVLGGAFLWQSKVRSIVVSRIHENGGNSFTYRGKVDLSADHRAFWHSR